ncbi:MAG: hypothetical protein QXX41_07900 [Nitrososphaerota archaeon]
MTHKRKLEKKLKRRERFLRLIFSDTFYDRERAELIHTSDMPPALEGEVIFSPQFISPLLKAVDKYE